MADGEVKGTVTGRSTSSIKPMHAVRPILPAVTSLALVACAGAASPSAALPSSPPASVATETAVPSAGVESGAVATIRVGDEEYRILLTDSAEIATAAEIAAGERDPLIPVGTIVRTDDGGVNTGYSWHIDPASFEWAELTMEVCDGRPSYVEDGTLTSDIFCPWAGKVIRVEPTD